MTRNLDIKYKTLLNSYNINTPLRLAHFFAQLYAESELEPKRESLYFRTIERAVNVFKTPFEGKSDAFVRQYLSNSKKMANYVYANRMGNEYEGSGDGFKYRGGGFIQITGFYQYLRLSKDVGIDFLENPELLEDEMHAMIAACWYWHVNNLNKYADEDNLDRVSDIINIGRLTRTYGDSNGFKHRQDALIKFKEYFKVN